MNTSKRQTRAARGTPARNRLYAGVFTALLAIGATAPVHAQRSDAPQEYSIQAGSLGDALNQLAAQSKLQIVYPPDLVKGKTAPALSGRHTLRTALQQLLQGTGLEWGLVNDSTVVIKKAPTKPTERAKPKPRVEPAAQREEVTNMPAIMVTGKRTLNTDIERTRDDIQPYVVFNRETIERSGATNLEDFFKKKLTMSTGAVSASQQAGGTSLSKINLRGLGSDETLILVDGRRVAGVSLPEGQADINGIPLSAIERIEILPTTASGIYGGGATGGVINIIMRRDYTGAEVAFTYGNTFDTDVATRRVDINAGWNLNDGRTNILLAGSYSDANKLLARDRDFLQRGRAHVLNNNPNAVLSTFYPPLGATTNIKSTDGSDLVLKDGTSLNSPFTYVPEGYVGPASDGGLALVSNAGLYNLDLANSAHLMGGRRALRNDPTVKSLMLTMRHEFTPRAQGFLELYTSENKGNSQRSTVDATGLIPANAPFNPFAQDIRVTVPALGLDQSRISKSTNQRINAGVIISLPRRWQAVADVTWNRSEFDGDFTGAASPSLATAISSGELAVLRDINKFPIDFSPFVGPALYEATPGRVTLTGASLRMSGPLPLTLPGGNPVLSMLLEHRNEKADSMVEMQGGVRSLLPSRSRAIDSAYLETVIPFFSSANEKNGFRLLELQIAVRHDIYEINSATRSINLTDPQPVERRTTKLSSTDPTIGVRYKPTEGLMLRASYGTGFLPPTIQQSTPPEDTLVYPLGQFGFTDPLRGNEPLGTVQLTRTGNISEFALRPEQSESWSAGFVLTPQALPGLRASLDWVRIQKTDNIAGLFNFRFSDLQYEEYVPGYITRATKDPDDPHTVGPITGIYYGLLNIASLETEAIDLALDYNLSTARYGDFSMALGATHLLKLNTQVAPGAPEQENAGVSTASFSVPGEMGGGLDWKATSSLTWQYGEWTLAWSASFFDKYYLNISRSIEPNQGSATIPSQTHHSVYGSYQFKDRNGGGFSKLLSGLEIAFGINNVLNRKPPVDVVSNFGFDYSPWADPRMANYYVTVRKSFGN